ncbi:FAD-dependent oxidoreductase [Microbulbifer hydrolyticus]|uniref:3-(3-hydroxy-phenyl)propionate hydroxylase n=1 Tax=Microbulbifer hydrolyticus TaxID=48074 RepID=A0A6P1TCF5_9GAMM|nr:NAD(P)/FAD-dependent oxidoreductase [Microbulbifer hydrolyticus]MBB5210152.1 3-(3-hydroxy-phenyl)propionate hydroxylase [Microbulbifer hydrolyticus]QHQ39333.1 FAD-dependent monooxygenase [Microbulbifer hydrolyticus]
MSTQQPVIIAGAGPSGCVLALSLAKQGIPVCLLEKCDRLPIDLRASTFHPPSLEMIADLGDGIIEKMLARGLRADRYQYRDRSTGEVATFDMSRIADETRFPFRLQLEQYELTRFVCEALQDYSCAQVRFGCELVDYAQDADGVTAVVRSADGEEQLRGSYLVGAEGARSVVRKKSGIGFMGFTYDEKFLVVSTSFPFEQVFEDFSWVNYVSDPEEWCVILRTDKLWRVLVPVFPASAEEEAYYLSDEFVQSRLKRLHHRADDYDIHHRSIYAVNQRVAETYYQGRALLVGDACHINNPLGGMGMNGGLHDAFNVADKLCQVLLDGVDAEAAFALYDRQRRGLAVQFVQRHTIENKKLMEARDPDLQRKRQQMLMEAAADPERAHAFLLERSMINCVRESLAVQ